MSSLVRKGGSKRHRRNPELLIDKPILLVEDDNSLAQLLSASIKERWEGAVHIASTYEEAKNLLNQYRLDYHVAVCDLCLPDAMNGEIIDLMKKAHVQTIIMSGQIKAPSVGEMLSKGAVDFIDKANVNAHSYVSELVGRLYKNYHIKILVVDDSRASVMIARNMLEIQNYQVLTAENGVEALTVLAEHPDIKVVLTDFNMPDMDGRVLTIKIREQYSREKLAIIGLSATSSSDLLADFIKNGANDFLMKPFNYTELLCRVNQNIDMLEHIERIHEQANRDYLTKLYNRRYFFQNGIFLYQRAEKNQLGVVMSIMDIDHFKNINDNYGHDVGDIVLIEIANKFMEHFSNREDLVARLGGEEFVVLFYNQDKSSVLERLEIFRADIEQSVVEYEQDKTLQYTISIGCTDKMSGNLDTMAKQADENLYKAKESGRNRVVG